VTQTTEFPWNQPRPHPDPAVEAALQGIEAEINERLPASRHGVPEPAKAPPPCAGSLYRGFALPCDEPVQFVGVYVLRWGREEQPSVGFVEADEVERRLAALEEVARLAHRYLSSQLSRDQAALRVALKRLEEEDHV